MEIFVFMLARSCNHTMLRMLFKLNCMLNKNRTKVNELMIKLFFFFFVNANSIKMSKGAHQSTHGVYNGLQIAPKWIGKTKNTPSFNPTPINQ